MAARGGEEEPAGRRGEELGMRGETQAGRSGRGMEHCSTADYRDPGVAAQGPWGPRVASGQGWRWTPAGRHL